MTAIPEGSVVRLDDVPRLDRFFPSCFWGLVELCAKHRFGVKDIKKAWISHTFVYRPHQGLPKVKDNGNLDVSLFNSDRVRQRVAELVRFYYGIEVVTRSYDDFSSLLSDIRRHLTAGDLPISAFNMGFLRESRAIGYGGDAVVSAATGLARKTIRDGRREIECGVEDIGRIRRAGAGRPRSTEAQPGLKEALECLVDPLTRGDPMSPAPWFIRSD